MARYLLLGKYSPAGLSGVRKDGYTSRHDGVRKWADSVGGRLECMYFMTSAGWDYAAVVECGSDAIFSICSQGGASGAFERIEYHELRTADEADQLVAGPGVWKPPSSVTT